jgi:hypothetical protein
MKAEGIEQEQRKQHRADHPGSEAVTSGFLPAMELFSLVVPEELHAWLGELCGAAAGQFEAATAAAIEGGSLQQLALECNSITSSSASNGGTPSTPSTNNNISTVGCAVLVYKAACTACMQQLYTACQQRLEQLDGAATQSQHELLRELRSDAGYALTDAIKAASKGMPAGSHPLWQAFKWLVSQACGRKGGGSPTTVAVPVLC